MPHCRSHVLFQHLVSFAPCYIPACPARGACGSLGLQATCMPHVVQGIEAELEAKRRLVKAIEAEQGAVVKIRVRPAPVVPVIWYKMHVI